MSSNVKQLRDEVRMLKAELAEFKQETRRTFVALHQTTALIQLVSGGDPELQGLTMQMRRAIVIAQQLQAVLISLAAARAAGGDPLAMLQLAAATAGLIISLWQQYDMARTQY